MSNDQTPVKDPESLSYEEARDELVAIVGKLEAGTASLDASLELWERGEALAKRCSTWLDAAQARLDGKPTAASETPEGGQAPSTKATERPGNATEQPGRATESSDSGSPNPTESGGPKEEPGKPSLRAVPSPGASSATARPPGAPDQKNPAAPKGRGHHGKGGAGNPTNGGPSTGKPPTDPPW